jgi:hypothetical protein
MGLIRVWDAGMVGMQRGIYRTAGQHYHMYWRVHHRVCLMQDAVHLRCHAV